MFSLVCFDISDDRIRYRAVKLIKGFGQRVQKSVFECGGLSEERFLKMKNSLDDLIDHETDSVRYYQQCRGCLSKIEYSGIGQIPDNEVYRVV